MAWVFNPFTGTLDQTGGGGGGTPGGSDTQVQFNDGGTFGGDSGLTFNKTTNTLTVGVDNADPGTAVVKGDINLDDGGSWTTTLQTITPTQDNTISLPNATGTVALVAGSSGQPVYNNAGSYAGLSTATIGATGNITLSLNGASGVAPVAVTGSWFVGTTPQVLIQPSNVGTAGAWSPNGTGIGVNAASGFTGNLLDLQVNGTSAFFVSPTATTFAGTGNISLNTTGVNSGSVYARQGTGSGTIRTLMLAGFGVGVLGTETSHPLQLRSNNSTRLTIEASGGLTVADANDIAVGTTTGTKIGTSTTQKLGFFNKTPVVQPAAVADATDAATAITQLNALLSRMRDLGLIAP